MRGRIKVANEADFGAADAARDNAPRIAEVPTVGYQDEVLLISQRDRQLTGAVLRAQPATREERCAVLMHPFPFVLVGGACTAHAHSSREGGIRGDGRLKEHFRERRAADVAVAEDEDADHAASLPEPLKGAGIGYCAAGAGSVSLTEREAG